MNFGITSVAAITVICYLAAEIVKRTPLDNRWIPVICGILGGALGVIAMKVIEDYPANDILTAIAVGVASGFSATGINQVGKQLFNNRK